MASLPHMCGTPRVIYGVCFVLRFVCVLFCVRLFEIRIAWLCFVLCFISRVYTHTEHDNEKAGCEDNEVKKMKG